MCNPLFEQDNRLVELAALRKKGFEKVEGPFVQGLDTALASFNVARQAYYSGTFIGNHVHHTKYKLLSYTSEALKYGFQWGSHTVHVQL